MSYELETGRILRAEEIDDEYVTVARIEWRCPDHPDTYSRSKLGSRCWCGRRQAAVIPATYRMLTYAEYMALLATRNAAEDARRKG